MIELSLSLNFKNTLTSIYLKYEVDTTSKNI